jgi:hypothetical protein
VINRSVLTLAVPILSGAVCTLSRYIMLDSELVSAEMHRYIVRYVL